MILLDFIIDFISESNFLKVSTININKIISIYFIIIKNDSLIVFIDFLISNSIFNKTYPFKIKEKIFNNIILLESYSLIKKSDLNFIIKIIFL
jgi:hypothetical protein